MPKIVSDLRVHFKVKFGPQTYSNKRTLVMISIFSVLDQKCAFLKDWSQIIKALCLVYPVFVLTN